MHVFVKLARVVMACGGIAICLAILFSATGADALQHVGLTDVTLNISDRTAFEYMPAVVSTVNYEQLEQHEERHLFEEDEQIIDVCDVANLRKSLGFDSCSGGDVFNTPEFFTSFDRAKPSVKVRSANGIMTRALATGTVEFYLVHKGRREHIILKNALYVPGLCRNLISTGLCP